MRDQIQIKMTRLRAATRFFCLLAAFTRAPYTTQQHEQKRDVTEKQAPAGGVRTVALEVRRTVTAWSNGGEKNGDGVE
jgi:hypothetical protein